mmetsp:Transcript_53865/g.115030  ORF Transcript_53865/g.115030 Transcript_53865/m.115030 type:complete len:100 (-) Transcript_53865:14-313(-)
MDFSDKGWGCLGGGYCNGGTGHIGQVMLLVVQTLCVLEEGTQLSFERLRLRLAPRVRSEPSSSSEQWQTSLQRSWLPLQRMSGVLELDFQQKLELLLHL